MFQAHKPTAVDVYDAELQRMNSTLAAENQGLLHDNKQLGTLIKEYEQTLESVMGSFRTRAVRRCTPSPLSPAHSSSRAAGCPGT